LKKKRIVFTDIQAVIVLIVVATAVLSIPLLSREVKHKGYPIGEESYFNSRISKDLVTIDNLIYGGRNVILNPYNLLLYGGSLLFDMHSLSKFLPFILGLVSLLLFYFLIRKKLDITKSLLTAGILVFSPIFMYNFLVSSKFALLVVLNLALLLLFLKNRRMLHVVGLLIFLGICFFGLSSIAISVAMLLGLVIYDKKLFKPFLTYLILVVVFVFGYLVPFGKIFFNKTPEFAQIGILQRMFTDLGGIIGFGIFAAILAVVGFIQIWSNNKNFYYSLFLVLLLCISLFFTHEFMFYLNFLIAYLVAHAIIVIIKSKWSLDFLKKLTLIIIVCGLLFSSISYSHRISNIPSRGIVGVMDFLQKRDKGVVFSSYKYGSYIEYTGNIAIMDSRFDYSEVEKRIIFIDNVLSSSTTEKALVELEKYNIKYILLDSEMKIKAKETGFIEVLKSGAFNLLFVSEDLTVWEVVW